MMEFSDIKYATSKQSTSITEVEIFDNNGYLLIKQYYQSEEIDPLEDKIVKNLKPGIYLLKITKKGFARFVPIKKN
ncbi:T9SS type A sorting domain-containing protein [Bacteroidota bacterium]